MTGSGASFGQCGEWRLEREIGRGAYGIVYLATGPGGQRAAVKICRRDDADAGRYERELRGAKLYRAIPPQDGLVRVRALVKTEWGFYAVMDLADDEFGRTEGSLESYRPKTLASVIKGEKALPLKECVNLAIALSKGLAALQRHHLLHRDIKPANVLYVCGRPVLSDPGLVVDESEATSLVGTPGYVPPEKFTDAASDVYSLGLTLKAASFGRQIEDIDKGPAMEADTAAPLFSVWWRILNKATDPTPSRRYHSAKALLKELDALQRRIVIYSIARSRIAKVLISLFAIAVVAAVVFLAFSAKDADNQRRADMDALLQKATEESRASLMRSAYRGTFRGISEEELSLLVDIDRRETFGGIVSEEEKARSRKIGRKYSGLDEMRSDLEDSLKELRRHNESLTNDLQTLQ